MALWWSRVPGRTDSCFLVFRYRLVHYAGVVLIMGGIGLSLVPKWHAMSNGATQWAVVVILLAALPSSAAFIKIETEFAAGRMEVLWGWFTINCWQVRHHPTSCPTFPDWRWLPS